MPILRFNKKLIAIKTFLIIAIAIFLSGAISLTANANSMVDDVKEVSIERIDVKDLLNANAKLTISIQEKEREKEIENAFNEIEPLLKTDKHQYFIEYKMILKKYDLKPRHTVMSIMESEEEYNLLLAIIEQEIGGGDFDEKTYVFSVILNRYLDDTGEFEDTISGIIKQEGQFSSWSSGAYKNSKISQETIDAVDYVFEIEDTTENATCFRNLKYCSDLSESRYVKLFTSPAGHTFYRIKTEEEKLYDQQVRN